MNPGGWSPTTTNMVGRGCGFAAISAMGSFARLTNVIHEASAESLPPLTGILTSRMPDGTGKWEFSVTE